MIALHFVSRIPSHAPLARQILAFQVKLAAHYGAYSVVDVASQLELQIEANDRYKDDMHYGPATWAHISELAWDEADFPSFASITC